MICFPNEIISIKIIANSIKRVHVFYREKKLGITPCCFSDLVSASIDKYLFDWQSSTSNNTVIDSSVPGVSIEKVESC